MNPQQPDSLRRILDSVFSAPAYNWVHRPEPLGALRRAWLAVREWLRALDERQPFFYKLLVYSLIAGALALVAHALWSFLKELRQSTALGNPGGSPAMRRDEKWYRAEADRLATEGRFAEAVQADFLALVLALDARRMLRFHPSKTPGEYARESDLPPVAREEFRQLVRRLYKYAFARLPCGPIEYAEWRAQASPERYAPAN